MKVLPVIDAWELTYNSDRVEGRGHTESTGIACISKELAIKFAESVEYSKAFGVMGTPGNHHDAEQRLFVVVSDVIDFGLAIDQARKMKLIQSARSKLTPAEQIAVGIL